MPGTACRLLQSERSTSTTTNVRAPQHHTRSRPLVQLFSRRSRPFGHVPGCGWPVSLARAGQPRFHGSGVAVVGAAKPASHHNATSPTAIARGRSLAPTRSTRAPHVADRDDIRPETTASPETRCTRLPRSTSLADARAPPCVPGPAAAGAPGEGRFACRPAKVSALSRTRGAFHRQVTLPFSGSRPTLHSLSPVCGKGVASASSIPDSALRLVTRAQAIEDSVAPGDDRP